ncbi:MULTISPECIES: hypothetical protein [unclassified Bradyrhizobium]|uniref:hypothetical protein n=1 Tax=unclassified Bradyrhizobium TaxID=2631580 RepID=UPI0024784933|nr:MULTISPECIES: hypothetical protein [unclassified Bradyrhizobium]WGR73903.1 hypothetical protein MTX24_14275 [Bradyrhizobium sp. ISRA426]WGR78740.1 hypothetical protein MTX21_39245 [Bradyrhizobium sp. ISRA430]WGR89142.1 hypothetical protein MTX25_14290 [Bradyrhizobium sp. ISRA432]
MSVTPTLYNLFDETDFQYWELQINNGNLPTPEQLARLLEANPDKPLPSWLRPLIIMGIRRELKAKRGRPPKSLCAQLRLWAAMGEYRAVLAQIQDGDDKQSEARSAHAARAADQRPAHERAAEHLVREWRLPMSWRSFLNEVHSKK